jgi:hypothetical protein
MPQSISSQQFGSQSMGGGMPSLSTSVSSTAVSSGMPTRLNSGSASSMSAGSNKGKVIGASHISSAANMNVTFSPKSSSTPKIAAAKPISAKASTPSPKVSASPSMSFDQMQAQSVEMEGNRPIGGTRRGEAPMVLPATSTITSESITAMTSGRYKPGTLGQYQKQSIREMQGAGRSPDFIIKNLNQATAMKIPNYNLPANQAQKAGAMVRSGRTQSFIRAKLGVSPDTPVPGKPG